MGKTPIQMKAVVYSLSPFQQKVMPGLWRDLPHKLGKKFSENWINATLLVAPVVGVYAFRLVVLTDLTDLPDELLCSVLPIKDITSWSHNVGAKVLVDACQSVPHMVVDVQSLDADFLVASSHKDSVAVRIARTSFSYRMQMCLSANKSSPTSNKSLHKVVVDWNKLPDDMLKLIVKHLGFPDFARFGSVCSSWRSLASVGLHLHHKGGRLPWLIVPYYDVVGQAPPANTSDNYCPDPVLGFFSILDGAIHKVDIQELQGRRICGSSFGWLITVHGNSEFQLLRPFTGKVVNLPPLTTFPHVGISEEKHNSLVYIVKDWFRVFPDMVWDTNRMRNQYIYKAITSPNAESPIVIAIPHHHAMLLFYKPGEDNDDPFIWKKYEVATSKEDHDNDVPFTPTLHFTKVTCML
ncbi:hypothetical protein IFM89_038429 [Coptis chinensis]|uniref:F-box domain-containing protein n=1 Tax=Coptis chinensis TaxID=261450 RepID=A0A835HB81_9MAGN|nr:hypothetical protein IFM89_038429 [Coptis chinensis]